MFEKLIQRENAIFNVLNTFVNENVYFIVIGGYAVSAYKHRFSVDADIIIRQEDQNKFEEILKKLKFSKVIEKDLDHIYTNKFMRYKNEDDFPVNIDLLIDGIGSRTTDASYHFKEIEKHSQKRKIIGIEKQVIALVPDKEILIVLKLHSGRLTDFRDIAALSRDIDIALIKKIIWRGKKEIVKKNIKKILSLLDKKEFIDSFKGIFIEKKYDIDIQSIKKLRKLF